MDFIIIYNSIFLFFFIIIIYDLNMKNFIFFQMVVQI